jgi:uncharacterized membrane protein YfhO
MQLLDSLNVAQEAVYNTSDFPEIQAASFTLDSAASVALVNYKPNFLKYQSQNSNPGLIVFSEMYYPNGWEAFIDGKPVSHFRVNYTLRALRVPAGSHAIEFRFNPEVIKLGSTWALAGSIGLLLVILGGIVFQVLQWFKSKPENDA